MHPYALRAIALSIALVVLQTAIAPDAAGQDRGRKPANGGVEDSVVDLRFADFFRRPIGPLGLDLSERLTALNGKRVRIRGYMVAEEAPTAGRFLLAPFPVALSDVEDGPADDLPAAVVFVHLSGRDAYALPVHHRAPLALTGRLEVGNRDERDGRVSLVRLRLDAPSEPPRRRLAVTPPAPSPQPR